MASVVDITDLIRGEGEWKNMQEIVRRTFKICFDQMQKQSEQITKLAGNVASLKVQLAARPDFDEIDKMIESKSVKTTKGASREEFDKLSRSLVNVKADLERKAAMSYVDDCLRRKVDKSDILVHNLSKMTSSQYAGDIEALHCTVEELKLRMDSKTDTVSSEIKDLRACYAGELSSLRGELGSLEGRVSQYFTKSEISVLLDQKQSAFGLDSALSQKADSSSLVAATTRIEHTLAEHEKLITALRIKSQDQALFNEDPLLRAHPATQHTFDRRRDNANARSSSYSNQNVGEASREATEAAEFSREEGDMGSLLKTGRIEAIVHGLWDKMNNVILESARSAQEVSQFRAQLAAVEGSVRKCAGLHNVETLGAVVEEQRLRLDSLILGSTPIEPIVKELRRLEDESAEVRAFLSMPQQRPLREQLDEAGQLIDVLSHRVSDIGTALGRAGMRLESLEVNTHQLDTRITLAESLKERVDRLHRLCDCSDTDYTNAKDIGRSLAQLWAAVKQGAPGGAKSLSDRVDSVEGSLAQSAENIAALGSKVGELKQIVYSLGVGAVGGGLGAAARGGTKQHPQSARGSASYAAWAAMDSLPMTTVGGGQRQRPAQVVPSAPFPPTLSQQPTVPVPQPVSVQLRTERLPAAAAQSTRSADAPVVVPGSAACAQSVSGVTNDLHTDLPVGVTASGAHEHQQQPHTDYQHPTRTATASTTASVAASCAPDPTLYSDDRGAQAVRNCSSGVSQSHGERSFSGQQLQPQQQGRDTHIAQSMDRQQNPADIYHQQPPAPPTPPVLPYNDIHYEPAATYHVEPGVVHFGHTAHSRPAAAYSMDPTTTAQHTRHASGPHDDYGIFPPPPRREPLDFPPPQSMLSVSRLTSLTSEERVDQRLEELRREKLALKQKLLSRIDL